MIDSNYCNDYLDEQVVNNLLFSIVRGKLLTDAGSNSHKYNHNKISSIIIFFIAFINIVEPT